MNSRIAIFVFLFINPMISYVGVVGLIVAAVLNVVLRLNYQKKEVQK